MKTKLLLIVLLIGGCCTAAAQSRIWEMPTIPADTTIVREWKEGKYIVYSRQGTSQRVSYHDNSSPVVRSAQIPSYAIINDFRIAGDMVYAGGKVLGTPYSHGLLACFDINDLLGNGGVFHTLTFNGIDLTSASPCYNIGVWDYTTGVKRLSLFNDGGISRVAYIADDTVASPWPFPAGCRRTGYGDAAYTGGSNGPWSVSMFDYNKDAENQFTDITTTDSHIVLVSWDCSHNKLEFILHDKHADCAYLLSILSPTVDIYYFTDHKVLGRVMATALGGDRFAVAYHYDASPLGAGLAIKIFNINAGVPALQYSLEIPPTVASPPNCEMRDIRYVRGINELWLLNDIGSPATGLYDSYLYRIDLGNVYTGTYEARFIPGCKLHSLDYFMNDGYIVSGSTGPLDVLTEQNTSSPVHCSVKETVNGRATAPTMQVYGRPLCPIHQPYNLYEMPFTVDELPIAAPCSY